MSGESGTVAGGALLFVYAADGGPFNTAMDIAHKIFSPQTYACRLCALTHGHFRVRKEWQTFIRTLAVPCVFLHRDQAVTQADVDPAATPAVYRRVAGRWVLCLSPGAIAECQNLAQLQRAVLASCMAPAAVGPDPSEAG